MKVYRVENPKEEHGLWRNFDGSPCDVFSKLTVGKCKNMPMPDNDFYRQNGKQWFSATDTPEKLQAWFDVLDIIQMRQLGYKVYEFEVTETKPVSEYEVVFTRESIISCTAIDPAEIWQDYDECLSAETTDKVFNELANKIVEVCNASN